MSGASKSLVTDGLIAAGQIGIALLPTISEALAGGTPAVILTHAMLVAAEEVALRRSDTHGERPHPLVVVALRVDDLATLLVVEHQPVLAASLRDIATELRKRAAAVAPTEPAPGTP